MILCFVISIVSAVVACWHGARLYIFKHCPHLTAKTGAWREETEHRKNRRIWFGVSESKFVKDTTIAWYRYEVNGCSYYFKLKHLFSKPSETSYMVPVVYVKRFPRIHNTEENELFDMSILWAGIFTAIALLFFIGAFML